LSCRRAGHKGTVLVRCEVGADGRVRAARVVRASACRELDAAAREALLAARFEPARQAGKAVASAVEVPVVFQLEGRR
jgi:protein TonB